MTNPHTICAACLLAAAGGPLRRIRPTLRAVAMQQLSRRYTNQVTTLTSADPMEATPRTYSSPADKRSEL
jgi:hypothetical protein